MFKNPRIFARVELLVYLLILIAPVGMYITTARKENWVKKADVSAKETYTKLADIPMDPLYHFDSLTEPLANGNRAPEAKITRSSMYSSVTNSAYSDLYYDVLNTPDPNQ